MTNILTEDEKTVLEYFFTNIDEPIYCMRRLPQSMQNYLYASISRFPDLRKRFLEVLKNEGVFEEVVKSIKTNKNVGQVMGKAVKFAEDRVADIYLERGHGSAGEGSFIFVVCEENPIYATAIQQDFFFPMTTMELSTRFSRAFNLERTYLDPVLMKSEFAEDIKKVLQRNFDLYNEGFKPLMDYYVEAGKKDDLSVKGSVLDSIRYCIPIAAYTGLVLGGNTRSIRHHFIRMLLNDDGFIKYYTKKSFEELSKISPQYFSNLTPDYDSIKRNQVLQQYADEMFKGKFIPTKENLTLIHSIPLEDQVLTQILYLFCNIPFLKILDKVSSLGNNEKKEIFEIATKNRKNRANPIRGFESRHLVFELETPWALWKDFKRNRMNLRFQQHMRGTAGFATPELIAGVKDFKKKYEDAMTETSELMERIHQKFGVMCRAAAAQASRKRYLLTMGPRQLTVLTELRTSGEGDKGYRRIASKMISLAKETNERLYSHIHDNFLQSKAKA